MSWFGKRTTPLFSFKEYAEEGLFDLHAHLLPNVDDGAANMDEAMAILDGLAALGFVKVAATPHFNCRDRAPGVVAQSALISLIRERRESRSPEVVTGAETLFDELFLEAEQKGEVPSIAGGSAYLIELGFGPGSIPIGVENAIFKLRVKEKYLILAHPERASDFQRDLERLTVLRRGGVLVQLDVMSLVGKHGNRAKSTAYRMLESEIVDLAATDIHAARDLPRLEEALRALVDWDKAVFKRLFSRHPRLVMAGRADEVISYE